MTTPFVSLVVVNYNGASIIEKCLQSLLSIDYSTSKYEILVVDNASSDASLKMIKKFKRVKLIQNKKNLGYVGVNSSLKVAKGKYLFVLNNDIEMTKNCVQELVNVLEKDDMVGVAVPKFVNFYSRKLESSGTWVSRSFYTGHYRDPHEKQRLKEVPYLGIELIRTSLAKKFGYIYDPDYFIYAEDLDLSLRYRLLGYTTMYVPSATLYHMHSYTTTKGPSTFMTHLLERNLLMTYFKILRLPRLVLYMPYVLGMRIIALARDLVTLQFAQFWARLKAIFWIVFHVPLVLKKRSILQKMRTRPDSFVTKLFSEKYLFSSKKAKF